MSEAARPFGPCSCEMGPHVGTCRACLHSYNVEISARLSTAEAEVVRLREALKEWVDYFDMLNRHSDPSDPLVIIRNERHGPRIARSRAALSPAKETK